MSGEQDRTESNPPLEGGSIRRRRIGEGTWIAPPQNGARRDQLKRTFACTLRANATDAERKLWSLLRCAQMSGLRWRRQQPVGPYIADFYCSAAKMIVECDGEQHGEKRHLVRDEARTRWFEARGYCVLRAANAEIFKEPERVIEAIWNAVRASGCPLPERADARSALPQGEGGSVSNSVPSLHLREG